MGHRKLLGVALKKNGIVPIARRYLWGETERISKKRLFYDSEAG
jgi:hypothetical protein